MKCHISRGSIEKTRLGLTPSLNGLNATITAPRARVLSRVARSAWACAPGFASAPQQKNWKRNGRVGSPETRRPASTLLAQAPTCGPLSHVYGSQSEKQLLRSRLRELLERQVFTPPSPGFHCEKTPGIPFLVGKTRAIHLSTSAS